MFQYFPVVFQKKNCFNGVVIKSFLMFLQPIHLNMLYKIITDSIGS
jgi:hypothetical protein